MTDLEFIKKIEELKKIKPRKDWVILTKKELFRGEVLTERARFSVFEIFPRLFHPYYKYALATIVLFGLLITGAFGLSQNALPGDLLYSLKRVSEKGQAFLAPEAEKPQVQLEITNKRLEELATVAQTNQTQKLSPAINEFQASASQAAKNLQEPQKLTKEIVQETKKIEENKTKIESLGVIIGDSEELDNALSQLVDREIKALEKATLTEDQAKTLAEAKIDYENNDFSAALEKILLASSR
jgi:vacuolar-type H+-ATPase subunit I/STV1